MGASWNRTEEQAGAGPSPEPGLQAVPEPASWGLVPS